LEWNRLCANAEALLHVTTTAFGGPNQSNAIVENLRKVFEAGVSGREVGAMPLACTVTDDDRLFWSGADVVLGDLAIAGAETRFELASETLCTQLDLGDGAIPGAVIRHLPSNKSSIVRARVFIVAADAFRTPQLLWASGIKLKALGRYLNDHPQIVSAVRISDDLVPYTAKPLESKETGGEPHPLGVFWVPFDDPAHPFHGQVMHLYAPGVGQIAGLVWFSRKEIRSDDCVEFSETDRGPLWMPRI
jgi:hypothetical protein